MNLRTIAPGLLVVGLLMQSTTSRAQEAIGSATSVRPQAEANARTLAGGSTVYSKELVRKFDLYAYIQTGALGTTAAADLQDSEATIYGIGTTDGLFGTPNPAGLNTVTSSSNGSTGYG